jgi:hypothetical protein
MRVGKKIATGQNITVNKSGTNSDIIKAIHYYLPYAIYQSKRRSSMFEGKNNKETANNIWSFIKHNINYIEDSISFQDIKLPNRLIKDKKGDCKSFSMLAASILENLGIPYKFAYTSYTNSKTPGHVYIQTDDGYIIDAVWNKFNSEKPYTYKYLKKG